MINIGILGAAQVAPYAMITPVSSRSDCTITAVACRDQTRGQTFAEKHAIPNVDTDYHTLLQRNDIDLIYNALPPSRHADLSIAALEAGKAVLCEKPFAMNSKQAQRMVNAARSYGQPLMEAFHYRHHPAFDRLLEIINSGLIGRINQLKAVFVAPVPYREGEVRHTLSIGGGSLMDMGCYPVHWARTLFGDEPTAINARCITNQPNIDTTTYAQLHFTHGRIANIECSMDSNRPFQAELSVWGTAGEIHFDNPLSPHNGHKITIRHNDVERSETVSGDSTYHLQLAHILDVMRGTAKPLITGQDSINNMHVIDRIYQQAGLLVRGTSA